CIHLLLPKAKVTNPASPSALKKASLRLGMPLPHDLLSFYRFSNGLTCYGRDLIYPIDRLVEENLFCRKLSHYMPMSHFVFFGGDGGGDEYAFGRRMDGEYHSTVFVWRNGTDEREEYEGCLERYLARWATDFQVHSYLRSE